MLGRHIYITKDVLHPEHVTKLDTKTDDNQGEEINDINFIVE